MLEDAENALIQLLRKEPTSVRAYEMLFELLMMQRKIGLAIAALQQILRLDFKHAAALNNLGFLYLQQGQLDDAIRAYRAANDLQSKNPQHQEGLTIALLRSQRLADATESSQRMVRQFPKYVQSHILSGHVYKTWGDGRAALAAYKAACDLDPNHSEALFHLVQSSSARVSELTIRRIARLSRGVGLSSIDAAYYNFALAKFYEREADYSSSFTHYQLANIAAGKTMSDIGVEYDNRKAASEAGKSAVLYSAEDLSERLPALPFDVNPIFIVGMPRSGTTLVEQILASHSQVKSGGELPLVMDCYNEFRRRRLAAGQSGAINFAGAGTIRLIADMRERYIEGLFERDLDDVHVTDKMPANAELLGFIRLLFPSSIIVNCNRCPVATCWSIYTTAFIAQLPYSASFEKLAHKYRIYSKNMAHWRRVLSPPIVDVEYEKLVLEPEYYIEKLVTDCGLQWEPGCLRFYEVNRPVFTASYAQVRKPIYVSSIDRWKTYEPHLDSLKELLKNVL